MPLSVTKGEGFTVFTVTSDPGRNWPLLCQVFTTLCCSPVCAVSGRLRKLMAGPQSALATVQIMMGLLTLGLGAVLLSVYFGPYYMRNICPPYWLGPIFIVSGILCLFAERFPSPCLVFLTSVVNMTSAIFAVVAIVFYAVVFDRMCYERGDYNDYRNNGYYGTVNLTDLVRKANDPNLQLCRMYERTVLPVAMGVNVLLLVTAVLQLCVSISVAVLAIKAVEKKDEEKVPEVQQPLMEEVTANHVA
ncbi:uncharacterized protein LOC118233120 isoform X5 [Anguilla anguilla]|uniref:uncharacterized protein LOC118233120 isoform X5 n=1 Tax=Anguilla anguilla TaxID=7936 RepID=UPI0015AE3BF7|nr:uncharacterized protein LOC118233120 isoform X5 [Anguilla anguilla]